MKRSAPIRKLRREGSESLNTVSGLRQELEALRESTREALQKSWAEVEQLQEEAMVNLERISMLERNLELSRAREEDWKRRCEEQMTEIEKYKRKEKESEQPASHDSLPITSNHSFTRRPSKDDRRNSTFSIITRRSFIFNDGESVSEEENQKSKSIIHSTNGDLQGKANQLNGSNSSLDNDGRWLEDLRAIIDSTVGSAQDRLKQDERERMEAELLRFLNTVGANKDMTITQLNYKISGRDSAISEIERTMQHQSETLQLLNSDLEKVRTESAEREKEMTKEIKAQKKRVHEKKKIIFEQMNQLQEFQKYISQLTDELEKICKEREDKVDYVLG